MRKSLLFLLMMVLFLGCTKFEEPPEDFQDKPKSKMKTRSGVELANQNPYSLSNMQIAMDQLSAEAEIENVQLKATHVYVRFLPKDTTEYDALLGRCRDMMYDYPLDRILTDAEVEAYANDSISANGFGWQYVAAPVCFLLPPDIECEFLDSLYMEDSFTGNNILVPSPLRSDLLPPDDLETNPPFPGIDVPQVAEGIWDELLNVAIDITSDEPNPTPSFSRSWYPLARIKYVDDLTNKTIPLEGVRIRCNHFSHRDVAYTDKNGVATDFGSFKDNVRYTILWESDYWDIRDGNWGQDKTHGPSRRGDWELTISGDNEDAMSAAIHRGCRAVYYDNPFGTTKPRHLKIGAHFSNVGDAGGVYSAVNFVLWPQIRIYRRERYKNDIITHTRYDMTSTTIHELTHAAHQEAVRELRGSNQIEDYMLADIELTESWARCAQYAFMHWLYPQIDYRTIHAKYSGNYTGVGEWLMHQGLSFKQLEGTVVGNATWDGWRRSVKALGLVDDVIVDMLFDNPNGEFDANFKDLIQGTSHLYVNNEIVYEIPNNDLLTSGVSVLGWFVSGDGYEKTPVAYNPRMVKLKFTTVGERFLTVRLGLIGGATYDVVKKINVTVHGAIAGPSEPYPGVMVTYRLSGFSGTVDTWQFMGINSSNYRIVESTNNSVSVIFKNHCTTVLKAKIQSTDLAAMTISVRNDASLTPFVALKKEVSPWDIQLWDNSVASPTLSALDSMCRTQELIDSPLNFVTYASRPSSTHPDYPYLIPVYESGYYHGYSYNTTASSNFTNHGVKFWIFSSQRPGTVPIYLIERSRYAEKSRYYEISYLTREDLHSWKQVTSWYWNWLRTRKIDDRNWDELKVVRVLGYVYPY